MAVVAVLRCGRGSSPSSRACAVERERRSQPQAGSGALCLTVVPAVSWAPANRASREARGIVCFWAENLVSRAAVISRLAPCETSLRLLLTPTARRDRLFSGRPSRRGARRISRLSNSSPPEARCAREHGPEGEVKSLEQHAKRRLQAAPRA